MMRNRKVLILESDYAARQDLANAVRKMNGQVYLATQCQFVIDVAKKSRPDVVILDSNLTGGAIDALALLKNNPQTASIPVVAIAIDENEASAFKDAGAAQTQIQPVNTEDLLRSVEEEANRTFAVKLAPKSRTLDTNRLQAIRETGLLDSAPEEEFNRLTELAAKLLGTPTALMSLVDQNRQFFKAQVGLGEPWSSQRETPLTHSFCQWVVSSRENLVVFDASKHPVLSHNDAVKDLGVSAYAGVPITSDTDEALGSFCVIDSKPKEFTADDIQTLEDLTAIINSLISLRQTDSATENNKGKLIEAAGNAVRGASRILSRPNPALGLTEKGQLSRIVEKNSKRLVELTSPN